MFKTIQTSLPKIKWIALGGIVVIAVMTVTLVIGQTSVPNIPKVQLSSDPLYAAAGGDKPAMTLALSVEFPTVGAQYPLIGQSTDNTYSNTKEYIGYYDAESCYRYIETPTDVPLGVSISDYKRFDRIGPAIALSPVQVTSPYVTSRICSNAFSGNFLNWSSSSAIDMLRLALSGGDRYVDTPTLTVLQRAVLPNVANDPICMWNSRNFPAKRLVRNGGGNGKYFGAVPDSMIQNAGNNDIFVSNTLNRIYFATSLRGSCLDTRSNNLGTPVLSRLTSPGARPLNFLAGTPCANGSFCGDAGRNEILFGSPTETNTWVTFVTSGSITCTAENFEGGSKNADATCLTRPYTGAVAAPAAPDPESSDAFFYARVNVCNSQRNAENQRVLLDDRDYKLCTRYPNGMYKPTGSIQKYSEQLRLAAFGYVLEQTASYSNGRYGGVLRAPMKFVGAKTFDVAGLENTPTNGNPKAEWDVGTGVFTANPDNDNTQIKPISGVINYLNKFGRTGPLPGNYKKFDPVGELHYEALRYLQGLQPSAAAISGLNNPTSAFYDGFPIKTTWEDPYGDGRSKNADYSCLKSNIVVIGDKNTHDGNRLPTTNLANNIPNISAWRSVVQNFEKGVVSSYLDGQNTSRQTSNPNLTNGSPASGSQTSQIMGTSYWSRTHDIRGTDWTSEPLLQRPGLRAKTFIFDVNENGDSTPDGARRTTNQLFTAAKYGGFETDASNFGGKPYNTFGNPFKRQDGTNDNNVWEDLANPGEASTYYLQSDGKKVLAAFDSIFSRSANSARSIAGSSVGSRSVTTAGSLIYQASFDTTDWNGDVLAFPITVTSGTAGIASDPTWKASTRLDLRSSLSTTRNIIVGKRGATANPVAVPFTWATIDLLLKTDLAKVTPTSAPDSLGNDRLNYIRGDKTKEGNPFRARSKLLGDIVNSGVVYSGAPIATTGVSAGFAAFRAVNIARTPAVFVGANDGMLHAFDAVTGDELFGYIPSSLGPKLAALSASNYNSNHQLYVDATPVVADAKVGQADTANDWKTVLVSGMGGGGSGVFALDVSNPSTFSSSNVLWEFTRGDDLDMGNVVGTPRIVKLRTSPPGASTITYRSFAAVASGVNNYVPENGLFSESGQPALFLLALDKAAGATWTSVGSNANYYKINLPVDTTLQTTNATGLINFKPIIGPLGETQKIFMGDLHGKVWKLDFTKLTVLGPTDWTLNKLTSFNKGTAGAPVPYPLFTARTAAGLVQPITMAPLLAAGPIVAGLDTTVVGFGTGKYLEASDKTSTLQQSFYAIYDNGTSTSDGATGTPNVVSSRNRLRVGMVDAITSTVTVPSFRFGRATTDTPAGTPPTRSGWYFDFPINGERTINTGSINGDFFLISSLIPASPGAIGSCTAAGGGGSSYALNIDSGSGTFDKSTVGLLGDSLIVKVGETDNTSDSTGRGTRSTVYQRISIGSTGISTGEMTKTTNETTTRRITWRQINNYQDLKRTP